MSRKRVIKDFDNLRIHTVCVNIPNHEYKIIKERIQGDSDSSGIRKLIIGRIDDPSLPYCLWKQANPLDLSDFGYHQVSIRMTREEYEKFVNFADAKGYELTECVRRLIFGLENL